MRDQSVRPVLLRRWQVCVALLLPSLLVNSAQNSSNGGPAYIIHIQSVDVDINPATETGATCKAGAEGTECVDCRNNPRTRCMCGNVFLNNQTAEELNETVAECNSLLNDHSFLTREPQDPLSIGFCKDVLNDLNYTVNVSVNEFMVAPSSRVASGEECPGNETIVVLTEEQLNATIVSMQDKLTQFIEMLNRTIVGVYLRAAEQRCTCMKAYKQWLCTTQLPFYTLNESCPLDDPKRECLRLENGMTIERLRPCLSVCHRVLQQCPYFNPSEFQPNSTSTEDLDIIYGGFPAFDCPDPHLLWLYNRLNESTCGSASYSLADNCISGGGSGVLHSLVLSRLSLTVLLFVLWVLLV